MANLRTRPAAEYLRVSKSLLDKMRCYGGGPVYAKLGSTVIYDTADLDAWVASKKLKPANDNGIADRGVAA